MPGCPAPVYSPRCQSQLHSRSPLSSSPRTPSSSAPPRSKSVCREGHRSRIWWPRSGRCRGRSGCRRGQWWQSTSGTRAMSRSCIQVTRWRSYLPWLADSDQPPSARDARDARVSLREERHPVLASSGLIRCEPARRRHPPQTSIFMCARGLLLRPTLAAPEHLSSRPDASRSVCTTLTLPDSAPLIAACLAPTGVAFALRQSFAYGTRARCAG